MLNIESIRLINNIINSNHLQMLGPFITIIPFIFFYKQSISNKRIFFFIILLTSSVIGSFVKIIWKLSTYEETLISSILIPVALCFIYSSFFLQKTAKKKFKEKYDFFFLLLIIIISSSVIYDSIFIGKRTLFYIHFFYILFITAIILISVPNQKIAKQLVACLKSYCP